MTEHPLVKRRTIVVWMSHRGRQLQSVPLAAFDLEDQIAEAKKSGWRILYLVRCRPRYRGGWTDDPFTTHPDRDPSRP